MLTRFQVGYIRKNRIDSTFVIKTRVGKYLRAKRGYLLLYFVY